MSGAWERELYIAESAARRAGEIALDYRNHRLEAESKSDESPVTIADRECERFLCQALSEAFPEDGLLGEEGALKEARSGRRWIIDPIDGTRDYIRGNDTWGVLIALEADGEVVAGVCNLPAQGELYFACRGGGAWRNQTRIHVSGIAKPSEAVLCLNGLNEMPAQPFAGRLFNFMDRFWAVRSFGGCQDAMMVAGGRAEAWIEPSAKAWDIAALKVIVEEAGGRFFNFDGASSIYGGNCVCSAPGLAEELRRFVAGA